MKTFRTETEIHGTGRLARLTRTIALATVLAATVTTAQAADSNDRITPPNPNEVAILRGLLALQHPALRHAAGSAPMLPSTALTTEPGQQQGVVTPAATEGEACVSPESGSSMCGVPSETSTAVLRGFRASLERSLAAAGYETERL